MAKIIAIGTKMHKNRWTIIFLNILIVEMRVLVSELTNWFEFGIKLGLIYKTLRPRPLPRRTNKFLDRKFIWTKIIQRIFKLRFSFNDCEFDNLWPSNQALKTLTDHIVTDTVILSITDSVILNHWSARNCSEDSEWHQTKIVIIVNINDLWENNKCFANSFHLLWCVVRQSDHKMSLHKSYLYH